YAPDWWSLDLHGYRRPEWFIQGPAAPAFAYHHARRSGHRLRSAILRRAINLYRWQLGSPGCTARVFRRLYGNRAMLAKRVAIRGVMRMFTGIFAWFSNRSTSSRPAGHGANGPKEADEWELASGRFGAVPDVDDMTEPHLIGYRAHSRVVAAAL